MSARTSVCYACTDNKVLVGKWFVFLVTRVDQLNCWFVTNHKDEDEDVYDDRLRGRTAKLVYQYSTDFEAWLPSSPTHALNLVYRAVFKESELLWCFACLLKPLFISSHLKRFV